MKPRLLNAARLSFPLAAAIAALLATPTANAAIYYWDDNAAGANFGTAGASTGTWDAPTAGGTAGWSLSATGANAFASFTTGTGDTLNFGNSATGLGAGTINVSTVDAGNMTFASGSGAIVLSGGTITLAAAQTTTVNNATNTIGSILAGAGTSFTKAGTGTLILTGANSYTGTTIIRGGMLKVGDGTTGSLTGNALTFTDTGTINFNEAAGSTQGMGLLTLTAGDASIQSTWAGSSTNSLTFSNVTARSAGATANFVQSGGTNGTDNSIILTQYGGVNTVAGAFIDKGVFFNGSAYAVANSVSGYLREMQYGTDTNTVAANTITAGRHVQLTATPANQNTISLLSLNLAGGGVNYTQNASQTFTVPAILKSGGGAVSTISGGTAVTGGTGIELVVRTDTSSDLLSISTPVTGTGVLAKSGAGTLTLTSSTNGYSGATFINDGTFEIGGAGRLTSGAHAGAISIASGATFNFNSSAATQTITGLITGAGGITMSGTGKLILANSANSYTGKTLVTGGIIQDGAAWNNQPGSIPGGMGNASTGSNIELNGGILSMTFNLDRSLGNGPGQIQITGGRSGISTLTNPRGLWTVGGNASFEVVWGASGEGAATGFFNPSTFVMNDVAAAPSYQSTLANPVDLNGANRTIEAASASFFGQINGVIRNSTGTAGLIKTGVGELRLGSANSFNGVVTVNQGTLTVIGNLANGGSNSALGSSSNAASNLLLANDTTLRYTGGAVSSNRSFTINGTSAGHGASLDASGSGAVNFTETGSPAYGTVDQTRTLTLTGTNTGNNILAANLADNGTGAVSVTKTGTGVWVLSGTNAYTGPSTLTGGTLSVGAASNLGDSSSNLVFNGGTLRITGTGLTNFASLGRTVTFNSGGTVGLDIADASNVFTVDQTLNQGTGGFTKAGAGTVVINSAHTYTGITTISGGTLRLDDGGVIPNSMVNNGVLLVNKTGAVTIGTDFPAMIGGSGSIAFGASTTPTITSPTQFESSALNTTGAGSVDLSGVTTPVFGGLVGTTGNLSSAFSSGYSGVTNLTLNTPSGTTFTYGGVINDGAAGMSLTKTGAGTQILTGTNTYTGTTFLNGGTLQLGVGSTIGKITGTTAIQFNGGSLQFNRSTVADIDAIPNGAPITVNSSSTFGVTSADAGNVNANESVGAVTLNAGQMNFNWTNGGSSGTQMILTSLSRSGTASANFNSGFASNNSRWKVTSAGSTTGGQIIGPWYTTGGNNAGFNSTDYAIYSSDFVAQAAITGSAQTAWTTAANAYTNSTGGTVTLTGTRTITALRNTGATTVLTLASGANLETYGVLNGVSTLLTIAPGTGGVLTTPSGGGNLYVNAGAGAITVSAPINNNGGNVTLVKNGGNTLTLGSTTSTYSGGTVINAGTVATSADTNLGSGGGITVNGTAGWSMGGSVTSYARTLTINEGATLTLTSGNAGKTVTGVLSGNGTLFANHSTDFIFNNAANTFTGAIVSQTANSTSYGLGFASIGDTADSGFISLVGGSGTFRWLSASGSTTTLANRQFAISGAGGATISAFGTTAASNLVISRDLLITGAAGARSLRLAGTNTGNNTFAGKITDGPGSGSVVSLTKEEAGLWIVSGTNTYSGTTTVSGGTLIGTNATQSFGTNLSGISLAATGTLSLRNNSSVSFTNGTSAYNIANSASGATINVDRVTGTGSNTITVGNLTTSSTAASWGLNFTGGNGVSLSAGNLNTPVSTTAGVHTITNNIDGGGSLTLASVNNQATTVASPDLIFAGTGNTIVAGEILNTMGDMDLIKNGAGTLTLNDTANTYTGVTTINLGVVEAATLANGSSNSSIGASTNAANRLVFGAPAATLRYIGGSDVTIDRSFTTSSTAGGGATIESSGAGTLSFDNTVAITYGTTNQTRTLTLGGTNAGANTFGKVIGNNGTGLTSIVKSGIGTWVLDQTNTYTGTTTVNDGTLAVTGSLGASAVSVNVGTLAGNGNIGGNVSIASGSTHSLAVAATAGAQVTRAITGTLTLTAGNILDLTAASTPAAGEYVLATATTAISGTPTTINYNGITGTVTVDTASNPKRLLLTVGGGTPYSNWAATFLPDDVSNPASNFDGDTLTNLQEFAFGTNPTSSTGSLVYVNGGTVTTPGSPVLLAEGGTYYAVFGRRESYIADGLTYNVQFSADLSSPWVTSGVTPTVLTPSGAIRAVSVPFPGLIATDSGPQKARFFRVEVLLAP